MADACSVRGIVAGLDALGGVVEGPAGAEGAVPGAWALAAQVVDADAAIELVGEVPGPVVLGSFVAVCG